MRIIAGKLGGRVFDTPGGHRTHPMGDKVRGGLFNTLGDITGWIVLVAFAGSGALSFEAVSRGATSAIAIESDRRAQATIIKNIEELELEDKVQMVKAYCASWSGRHQREVFDILLMDPPYDNLQIADMEKLVRHLKPEGIMVVSWPGKLDRTELKGLVIVSQKNYGDAQLVFYRHIS
jgi:16S rRNA (guanine966-N2)-methyltransferase